MVYPKKMGKCPVTLCIKKEQGRRRKGQMEES